MYHFCEIFRLRCIPLRTFVYTLISLKEGLYTMAFTANTAARLRTYF